MDSFVKQIWLLRPCHMYFHTQFQSVHLNLLVYHLLL